MADKKPQLHLSKPADRSLQAFNYSMQAMGDILMAGSPPDDSTEEEWIADRRKFREVPVCLMEVKYAQNKDIKDVHEQLARYYEAIKNKASNIAEEMEMIFRQKLKLGLYDQLSQERINAMKTLIFSRDIEAFQFILVLVDYNPNSSLLNMKSIQNLPFAHQVKIFNTGFGMWRHNVRSI